MVAVVGVEVRLSLPQNCHHHRPPRPPLPPPRRRLRHHINAIAPAVACTLLRQPIHPPQTDRIPPLLPPHPTLTTTQPATAMAVAV